MGKWASVGLGLLLCACGNGSTADQSDGGQSSSTGGQASSAGDAGQSTAGGMGGAATQQAADAGCTPTPPWPTPHVIEEELDSIHEQCGASPTLVGPLTATDRVALAIGLISPNEDELDRFAQEVSDPNSPLYRHYLTEEEFIARFGPSPCNYQAVVDWLQAAGLDVVQTYSDRFLIDANGTVAQVEAIFHVTLNNYLRPDGSTFYGPDRAPSVTVGPEITVSGLDNCFLVTPAVQ